MADVKEVPEKVDSAEIVKGILDSDGEVTPDLDTDNMAIRYPKLKVQYDQTSEALASQKAQFLLLQQEMKELRETTQQASTDKAIEAGNIKSVVDGFKLTISTQEETIAGLQLKALRTELCIAQGLDPRLFKFVSGNDRAEITSSIIEWSETFEKEVSSRGQVAPTATATAPVNNGQSPDWVSSAKKRGIPTSI